MGGVRPTCLALVLCDRVGRMSHSGLASPVGVLHTISATSFPMITRPFSAWMQSTQGNGLIDMALVIERLPPERLDVERLLVAPFSLHFADPNAMLEHRIRFETGVEIPCPGAFQARLTADEATIMIRPFWMTYVREREP
jgi:hypothetical protein